VRLLEAENRGHRKFMELFKACLTPLADPVAFFGSQHGRVSFTTAPEIPAQAFFESFLEHQALLARHFEEIRRDLEAGGRLSDRRLKKWVAGFLQREDRWVRILSSYAQGPQQPELAELQELKKKLPKYEEVIKSYMQRFQELQQENEELQDENERLHA
jgi:hypothetical protein